MSGFVCGESVRSVMGYCKVVEVMFEPILGDTLIAAIWLGCNLAALRIGYRISRHWFPAAEKPEIILHTMVLWHGIVLLPTAALGFAGLLSRGGLLAAVGVAVCLMGVIWRRTSRRFLPSVSDALAVKSWTPTEAGFSVRGRVMHDGISSGVEEDLAEQPMDWWRLGWLVLLCFFLGHVIVHGLLRFPTEFDTLAYHLSFVDHWLQMGTLNATTTYAWSAPANSELLALWVTGPFSGDFLVSLNNVSVVIVWAFATFNLAAGLGLRRLWAHLTTLSVLSVHTLFHETDDASNDLMVVAFATASGCYALRFFDGKLSQGETSGYCILSGISLGVLLGVKYLALGYFALLFGLTLLCCWINRGWRDCVRYGGVLAVGSLLWGGGWYVRNFCLTGSPLYPIGAPTTDTGAAVYPDLWSTTLAGNQDAQVITLLLEAVWKICGPVHYLAMMLIPTMLVLFLIFVTGHLFGGRGQSLRAAFLLVATLSSLAILAITPFAVEDQPGTLNHLRWAYTPVRYGLTFFSFSVMTLGWWLSQFGRQSRWIDRGLVCAFAAGLAWQMVLRVGTPKEFDFGHAGIVSILVFGWAAFCLLGSITYPRRGQWIVGGVTLAIWMAMVAILSDRWHQGHGQFYGHRYASVFLTEETKVPRRILVLDNLGYFFYGSRRQHHVIQPRHFTDAEDLEAIVESHEIEYVIARRVSGQKVYQFTGALEALQAAEDRYELVDEGREIRVFRVRPTEADFLNRVQPGSGVTKPPKPFRVDFSQQTSRHPAHAVILPCGGRHNGVCLLPCCLGGSS